MALSRGVKSGATVGLYRENHVDKDDERLGLFRGVVEILRPRSALYPGSFVHITPSFVIPTVAYVDSDRRAARFFADPAVATLIAARKDYAAEPVIVFHAQDYDEAIAEPTRSFDLLISQYAGFVSRACKQYLAIGGHLLVNNSHGDASMVALDPDFELVAVYQRCRERFVFAMEDLATHMVPKAGPAPTEAELERSMRGPAFIRRAAGYVFRRIR